MGRIWMGENAQYISFSTEITFDVVQNNIVQYVLGATTLALGAGLFFGGMTYLGLKLFKRSKPEP